MGYADYRIALDIRESVSNVIINAKRNDSGRRLYITLTEGAALYTPAEGVTAILSARKPDGNVIYNGCSMENGVVCCSISEQMTVIPGVLACEVRLLDSDGVQLTGAMFYLAVEETVFDEKDIPDSVSQFGFITALENSAKQALTQVSEAESKAAQAQLSAENAAIAAQEAVADAQTAIEGAQTAAERADAAAKEASAFSDQVEAAQQSADLANEKADLLKEALSAFHSVNVSASGDFLHLTDSAEGPIQSMKLYGKTTQDTTTGKNLLPYPYGDGESKTDQGITYTAKADGSVTASGTATADSYYILVSTPGLVGTYTVSGCPAGGSTSGYMIGSNGFNASSRDYGEGLTVVLDGSESQTNIIILIRAGTTVSNLVFWPQIEAGAAKTDYEPYTGGIASPNPDYPQDLVSPGEDGTLTVTAAGKNRFMPRDTATSGITFTHNTDGSMLFNGTATKEFTAYIMPPTLVHAGTYCVSVEGLNIHSNIVDRLFIKANGSVLTNFIQDGSPNTITIAKDMFVEAAVIIASGSVYENRTVKIQIEEGAVPTAWTPLSQLSISTPSGLCGIPVDSGGNYTDPSGQRWICDYVDLNRGVLVQNTAVIEVDGSTDGKKLTGTDNVINDSHSYAYIRTPLTMKINTKILSNMFEYIGSTASVSKVHQTGIYTSVVPSFFAPNDETGVTNADTIAEIISKINAWLAEKVAAAGEPVKVLYALETPTETALTDAEIEQYRKLKTQYLQSNISAEGADMDVVYLADTKTYIDNKFDALASAMLSS